MDRACFTHNGVSIMYKLRTWAPQNPHYASARQHQQQFSIKIWIGIVGDHLIGPHVLSARVNGNQHLLFLQQELSALMEENPFHLWQGMWIHLDDLPPLYLTDVRIFLPAMYSQRWIGHHGPISRPPWSPHLTPMTFMYGVM